MRGYKISDHGEVTKLMTKRSHKNEGKMNEKMSGFEGIFNRHCIAKLEKIEVN